jgi:hypothetical protein
MLIMLLGPGTMEMWSVLPPFWRHLFPPSSGFKQVTWSSTISTFRFQYTQGGNRVIRFPVRINKQQRNKLHGLSPRANYTDRAVAACRRNDCQLLRIEGVTWSA